MQVTSSVAQSPPVAGGLTGLTEAAVRVQEALASGRALELFRVNVESQGGDPRVVDDLSLDVVPDAEVDFAFSGRRWEDPPLPLVVEPLLANELIAIASPERARSSASSAVYLRPFRRSRAASVAPPPASAGVTSRRTANASSSSARSSKL